MNSTTINQSYLYRFERLVSKMVKPSEPLAICIIPHGGNLKLCAFGKEAILTMLIHNEGFVDPFARIWQCWLALQHRDRGG